MSRSKYQPLSLVQHFDAPADFTGRFAWVCGYSADAGFLDEALERFTRMTRTQRAHAGRLHMALMLDPGNPQISACSVPGLAHLALQRNSGFQFCLMHAKVAILGFRSDRGDEWRLKLIVSTGNWTRQTLAESLDLVWSCEIHKNDIAGRPDSEVRLRCADMSAAFEFLEELMAKYDQRLLVGHVDDLENRLSTHAAGDMRLVRGWVESARVAKSGESRFFDNRRKSLLEQLPGMVERIQAHGQSGGTAKSRNYICIGSGFFQGAGENIKTDFIPESIAKSLKDDGFLTGTAEKDLYVNPNACQGIASWRGRSQANGSDWTVRAGNTPKFFGARIERSLHAKFIFSANYRTNSNDASSGWVYLGSGNLTNPGFGQRAGRSAGNLEAGVVFATNPAMQWTDRNSESETLITNRLPVGWDEDGYSPQQLSAGEPFEPREPSFFASPVAYVLWRENDLADECWIEIPQYPGQGLVVVDSEGTPCEELAEGNFRWLLSRPRMVEIQWMEDGCLQRVKVPVVDRMGRVAATALPSLSLEEAWSLLANFPMPPEDEELPSEEGDDFAGGSDGRVKLPGPSPDKGGSYPVRRMMQLIEDIARQQTSLLEADWPAWCTRLEHCLVQAKESPVVAAFKELGMNPLAPLRQPPFRPVFAESPDGVHGKCYESVLARVEAAWGVDELVPLGEAS